MTHENRGIASAKKARERGKNEGRLRRPLFFPLLRAFSARPQLPKSFNRLRNSLSWRALTRLWALGQGSNKKMNKKCYKKLKRNAANNYYLSIYFFMFIFWGILEIDPNCNPNRDPNCDPNYTFSLSRFFTFQREPWAFPVSHANNETRGVDWGGSRKMVSCSHYQRKHSTTKETCFIYWYDD